MPRPVGVPDCQMPRKEWSAREPLGLASWITPGERVGHTQNLSKSSMVIVRHEAFHIISYITTSSIYQNHEQSLMMVNLEVQSRGVLLFANKINKPTQFEYHTDPLQF